MNKKELKQEIAMLQNDVEVLEEALREMSKETIRLLDINEDLVKLNAVTDVVPKLFKYIAKNIVYTEVNINGTVLFTAVLSNEVIVELVPSYTHTNIILSKIISSAGYDILVHSIYDTTKTYGNTTELTLKTSVDGYIEFMKDFCNSDD